MTRTTRGKGEGSIYKDNGLWTVSVELPPVNGVRRRKKIRRKDKGAVIRELTKIKGDLAAHGDLPSASQTLEQWLTYWLENIAAKNVRPKTLAGYRAVFTNHVIPSIGKVRLDKLTAAHIRRVTDAMSETHSSSYALNAHRSLSSALSDALVEGRVLRNVAKEMRAPKKSIAQLEALSIEEAAELIHTFGGTPDAYLWAAFLLTASRRGELLGLEWERVGEELDLSWQLQRYKKGEFNPPNDYEFRKLTDTMYLTRPKSSAGWRIIPLVEPLKSILQRWKEVAPVNEHGLVFTTAAGSPIDPDYATKQWPKVLKQAGIEKHVRLHDLRHTTIDLLYEAGVPEHTIMEIVGHSTRIQTRSYKSRGNRAQLFKAMESLSELIALR